MLRTRPINWRYDQAHRRAPWHCGRAVERRAAAREMGANTFRFFPPVRACGGRRSSIRRRLSACVSCARARHRPLVIHASYLLNVCSQTEEVRENSVDGFSRRDRARADARRRVSGAASRLMEGADAVRRACIHAAESIESAIDGLPWQERAFTMLIENTAGSECSLGGSFDQVAELVWTAARPRAGGGLPRHLPHSCCRI